ncbi:MAG: tetratricopeptide repeat protein [Phycisphaerae bacterium]|nr:tetratricopeptide repeat protein [Phycisphaerae bacterium]
MRNFILFIVAVTVLSFTGYILYRVYIQGESAENVFQEWRDREETDVLGEAEDAYKRQDYAAAAKGLERVLQDHETGVPGAKLEERKHRNVLHQLAACYKRQWEAGGKTDETLRIKALRVYEKLIDEYPDRHPGRVMAELKNPSDAASSKVEDESPPE